MPFGVAHEHVGTSAGGAQRAGRDGDVVAREIELRVPGLREEDLARIGDRHVDAVGRNDLALAFPHVGTITGGGTSPRFAS